MVQLAGAKLSFRKPLFSRLGKDEDSRRLNKIGLRRTVFSLVEDRE